MPLERKERTFWMDLEPLSMILVNGENHISNKLQILLSGDWITRHHLYKWKLMNDPSQIESFPYQQKRTWNSSLSDLLSLKSLWFTYGILMILLGNIPDQEYQQCNIAYFIMTLMYSLVTNLNHWHSISAAFINWHHHV